MTIEAYLKQSVEQGVDKGDHSPGYMLMANLAVGFVFGVPVYSIINAIIEFGLTISARTNEIARTVLSIHHQYELFFFLFGSAIIGVPILKLWVFVSKSHKRRLVRQYSGSATYPQFTLDQYSEASAILRKWKSVSYQNATETYPKDLVDLLIIAEAIELQSGKLRRMVSLRSIEQDREAIAEDDAENEE